MKHKDSDLIENKMRDVVKAVLNFSSKKRVDIKEMENAIHQLVLVSGDGDGDFRKKLLQILETMEKEGLIRMPSRNRSATNWSDSNGLPAYVTAVKGEEEQKRRTRHSEIEQLKDSTDWEVSMMKAIAPSLRTLAELKRAVAINEYLKTKTPGDEKIPHRERSLQVFGNERALDSFVYNGFFGGRVTLDDLDCFFSPDPLPYEPLSLDTDETAGKPLLIVESSNSYWSCCQLNQALRYFSGIVCGQSFSTSGMERIVNSLVGIERKLRSSDLYYFGDLDPIGLSIPHSIDQFRKKSGLSPLHAMKPLYQALLDKGIESNFKRSSQKKEDWKWIVYWLGEVIAEEYRDKVGRSRLPQEGLTAIEMEKSLKGLIG